MYAIIIVLYLIVYILGSLMENVSELPVIYFLWVILVYRAKSCNILIEL